MKITPYVLTIRVFFPLQLILRYVSIASNERFGVDRLDVILHRQTPVEVMNVNDDSLLQQPILYVQYIDK
jgi:hypothetical protein